MKTMDGQHKRMTASALFTDEEIRAIRRSHESGRATRAELAKFWGCGRETISRIIRGETYHWVKDTPKPAPDDDDAIAASRARVLEMIERDRQGE